MIQDLLVWKKDVLKRRDWDKIILKTVAPHLASYLRSNLVINPKNQDLRPFQVMLNWCQLITNQEMLNQLLTSEFFSKWMETLWIWLVSPTANGEQIGEWYKWWRSLFPEYLLSDRSIVVSLGFAKAQELMNQAQSLSSLGHDLKAQLPKPDLTTSEFRVNVTSPSSSRRKSASKDSTPSSSSKLKKSTARLEEITFRSIVEEEVEKKNLILIPMGKTLDSNGLSLFKVSNQFDRSQSSKNSLLISISDDVVFVKNSHLKPNVPKPDGLEDQDEWEPMLLEDMLERALSVVGQTHP